MAEKLNGHWYTDENGQHYFVENGQTPKEGWEASKRRKMLSGGKYKVSEDGVNYNDVSEDEYNKFEADEDFDLNNEDDFGFDEENEENILDEYGLVKDKATLKEAGNSLMNKFGGLPGVDSMSNEQFRKYASFLQEKYNIDEDDAKDMLVQVDEYLSENSEGLSQAGYGEALALDDKKAEDGGKSSPSIDYDEIERRKQNAEPKDEMGIYLDKQMNQKDADKLRKMARKITGDDGFRGGGNNGKAAENLYNNLDLKQKGYSKDEIANIEMALDDGKSIEEIRAKYESKGRDAELGPRNKQTGTETFNNLKKYIDGLSDDEKEMLKDLLNYPRK